MLSLYILTLDRTTGKSLLDVLMASVLSSDNNSSSSLLSPL